MISPRLCGGFFVSTFAAKFRHAVQLEWKDAGGTHTGDRPR